MNSIDGCQYIFFFVKTLSITIRSGDYLFEHCDTANAATPILVIFKKFLILFEGLFHMRRQWNRSNFKSKVGQRTPMRQISRSEAIAVDRRSHLHAGILPFNLVRRRWDVAPRTTELVPTEPNLPSSVSHSEIKACLFRAVYLWYFLCQVRVRPSYDVNSPSNLSHHLQLDFGSDIVLVH